jgi:hypothetical protein
MKRLRKQTKKNEQTQVFERLVAHATTDMVTPLNGIRNVVPGTKLQGLLP